MIGRSGRPRQHELRVVQQDLIRKCANPPEQGPGAPFSQERQVVLRQQLGHRLVIAGGRRVLGGLHHKPTGTQPARGTAVNSVGGAGLD